MGLGEAWNGPQCFKCFESWLLVVANIAPSSKARRP